MKYFVTILLVLTAFSSLASKLIVEGVYLGKSLYIQNPERNDGSYCITSINVNGRPFKTQKASAFRLDLFSFSIGTPVKIVVEYKDGCKPRIVNPQVIEPQKPFQFQWVRIDQDTLQWQTSGAIEHGRYFIMKQFTDRAEMIKVVNVSPKDTDKNHKVFVKHRYGNNTYFLKYLDYTGNEYFSEQVHYFSNVQDSVSFYPKEVEDFITFSEEVSYIITNEKGKIVKQGLANTVNCEELKPGVYFIDLNKKKNKFIKM